MPILAWLLVLLSLPFQSAEQWAALAGAECKRGCIVLADNSVYEVTRSDVSWISRMANCEFASVLDTADAPATMWAVVTNWHRRRMMGRVESLGGFAAAYSGCTSAAWATGGSRYSPRITPLADANRATHYRDLPRDVREFVLSFFRGEVENAHPTWCFVFTRGWESHAPREWGAASYARADGVSLNAYWPHKSTLDYTPRTIRIVPADADTAP